MPSNKQRFLGDYKKAAALLPFALRLEKQLRRMDRRYARRVLLGGSWVEVTIPNNDGIADIVIFGGEGIGAGCYIMIEQDWKRDGTGDPTAQGRSIYGEILAGKPMPNYIVYVVDGLNSKIHRLFWFNGDDPIITNAVGSVGAGAGKGPDILGYFFNDNHQGTEPLLHLHVDNFAHGGTTGVGFAEYLFVGEKRDFDTYTATEEGWQIWGAGIEDSFPLPTLTNPGFENYIFTPPNQNITANSVTGNDPKLWASWCLTDTSATNEFSVYLGYKFQNASYYGFNPSLYNQWIDFNNVVHWTYPIFNYDGPVDGWDVYNRPVDSLVRALFDWGEPIYFTSILGTSEVHFRLPYRTGTNGDITKWGIFSASQTTQTTSLLHEFTVDELGLYPDAYNPILLNSATATNLRGFAISRTATGQVGLDEFDHKIEFYVGTSYAAASLKFTFDPKVDLIPAYDPHDPAVQALLPGNDEQKTYYVQNFGIIDDTPGAEKYWFSTRPFNAELGYQCVVGTWQEGQGLTILYATSKPHTGLSMYQQFNEGTSWAKQQGGFPTSYCMVEWAFITVSGNPYPALYPGDKYWLPPKMFNFDKMSYSDLATKPIHTPNGSYWKFRRTIPYPKVTYFTSATHTLPLWP